MQEEIKSAPLVLLVNLGTPERLTVKAVRNYLSEFLSDRRIIDLPRGLWYLILHGIILRIRPKKSLRLYQKIWREDGSPLIYFSKKQVIALREYFDGKAENTDIDGKNLAVKNIHIDYCCRYGAPNVREKILGFVRNGGKRILIIPMYPQYSSTTTASVLDAVCRTMFDLRSVPEWRFIRDWHCHPLYISALADSYRKYEKEHGKPEKLLLSFHGIPKRYCEEGDDYREQVLATAKLLRQKLNFSEDELAVIFQSRFGWEEWLKPYAEEELVRLVNSGVRKIAVMCPGFSADCLETLEETAIRNREVFLSAGGSEYHYIPALNDDKAHIGLLADLISSELKNWEK
ncbi:MAG: ferrochelatase [Cardiobacteriaceae bacterium]|nr:ferrochelatase [Cardiobacteriaceae bacterium]